MESFTCTSFTPEIPVHLCNLFAKSTKWFNCHVESFPHILVLLESCPYNSVAPSCECYVCMQFERTHVHVFKDLFFSLLLSTVTATMM